VTDYGADPERCYITRAPQPVIDVGAIRKALPQNPELLFVGNDFRRKGGHTLLEAFRQGLLPECQLTIISNDDSLEDTTVRRVNVVRGLSDPGQIRAYYKRADLLVLPTLYDVYSNVVCEGMAFGLPFVATTVGAIGELIDQSRAGLALDPKCTPMHLAMVVRDLLSNEDRYLAMSHAACAYACNYLAVGVFDNQIRQALLRVGATR
jgi:glycosyltransferase involved in cell wall biosynthesis